MFNDKSQAAKLAVLQKVIDLMGSMKAKGLKKPGLSVTAVEGSPLEEKGESPLEELAEDKGLGEPEGNKGSDPSDDDDVLKRLAAEYARIK